MEIQEYDKVSAGRKRTLINLCIGAILQQLDSKTQKQLQQNQANLILKSSYDCLKRGDLVAQRQEEAFINAICDELYQRKENMRETKKVEQERIALELYEKFGIEPVESRQIDSEANKLTEKKENIQNSEKQNEANFFELYNPQVLRKTENQKKPSIQYMPASHSKTDNHIFEIESKTVTIRRIGELTYNTLNGESYLHQYLITKQDEKGNTIDVEEVYTDILISRMESDSRYREMVLRQLLCNNNLHMPNSFGYIGQITINWNEKEKRNDYQLEYLSEEYTAVAELQRMKQEKRRGEGQVK